MKNKIYMIVIFLFLALCMTSFFSNSFSLITEKEYFIPNESNIFDFNPIKMNDGSGDWWLYGEDSAYYYALNIDSMTPKYYKITKEEVLRQMDKIDRLDYSTWNK